jgi:hypothetical protein
LHKRADALYKSSTCFNIDTGFTIIHQTTRVLSVRYRMYFTGYVLLSTSDRAGALLWRSLYKEFIEFLAPEYR